MILIPADGAGIAALPAEKPFSMFKKFHWRHYLAHAFVAAILYIIPVFIFIKDTAYSQTWLLYLGNFLFMITMAVFLFAFNRRRGKNASSMAMFTASNITAVMGIIIACLLCFILISIMIPGLFHSGPPDKVLTGAPANTIQDKTHGLLWMVFGNAVIGNVATSFFVSIIFPFALKGDQTKEEVPPKQKEL